MGTAVVIDIPGLKDDKIIELAFQQLRQIDERFSPYKKTSELYRFNQGLIAAGRVSSDMKAVMKACLDAEIHTNGYFSAKYSGIFDPSGYVKGWAVDRVRRSILDQGLNTFCISAGGDIVASSNGEKTWRIGILNPLKKTEAIGNISTTSLSLATSGNYERGNHIVNPVTGSAPGDFVSVSIAGPDIIEADVLATAVFAMGKNGLDFIDKQEGYEVLAIDSRGRFYSSAEMETMLEQGLTITGKVV